MPRVGRVTDTRSTTRHTRAYTNTRAHKCQKSWEEHAVEDTALLQVCHAEAAKGRAAGLQAVKVAAPIFSKFRFAQELDSNRAFRQMLKVFILWLDGALTSG